VDSDVLRDEQQEQEENGKDEEDQTDVGAAAKLERRTPVMSHVYNTYTLYTAQMLRSLSQATWAAQALRSNASSKLVKGFGRLSKKPSVWLAK